MDSEREAINDLLQLVGEAKSESIALQAVCAALLAEVAILHKSPRDRLNALVASLQGVADGAEGDAGAPWVTETIERVSMMAEKILERRREVSWPFRLRLRQ